MEARQVAVIDIGSNSVRLVINQIGSNREYKELHNFKSVARLSAHIDKKGYLTNGGLNTLIVTLNRFKAILHSYSVDKVNIVATAAIRNAKNQQEIVEFISNRIGFNVRVLSDYEEAYYGYFAVINSTSLKTGVTIDIGGGSTEITLFENQKLKHYHSFPFGAIILQKQFFKDDQPTEKEINNLKHFLLKQFQSLSWLKKVDHLPLIGIGGSARNISLIHQRQTNYPLAGIHQYEFSQSELQRINIMLQQSTFEERLSIDGLSKERADIIIPAAEVITSLATYIHTDTFIMSQKGLRDGIFYEELANTLDTNRSNDVAEESFNQLSQTYKVNVNHVKHIAFLATSLYRELIPYCQFDHDEDKALRLLNQSAKVLYIGEHINTEASSQHTFYLLTNLTIEGISHQDRLAIAFISSFKSKSLLNQFARPFKNLLTKEQLKLYEFLGTIMKLSYSLDITRRQIISNIGEIKDQDGELIIPVFTCTDAYFEEMQTSKFKKHLEKTMKRPITFQYTVLNRKS